MPRRSGSIRRGLPHEIKSFLERLNQDPEFRKAYGAMRDYNFLYLLGEPRRVRIGDVEALISSFNADIFCRAHAILTTHSFSFKGSAKDIEQAMRKRGINIMVYYFNQQSSAIDARILGGYLVAALERSIMANIYGISPGLTVDDLVEKFIESIVELGWVKPDPIPSVEEALRILNTL